MKKEVFHKAWCAKIIGANAEIPWNVRCDCQQLLRHKKVVISDTPITLSALAALKNK